MSRNFLPKFSSKCFVISDLTFMSSVHFELIFVYSVKQESRFSFYVWMSNFPSTIYWRDYALPILCFSHSCEDQLTVDVWMYIWALCTVPLICKPHYARVKLFPLLSWLYQSSSVQLLSSVQSLSRVQLFATPWITACQASLSITYSQSSLRFMSIESVMPSSHLILCRPLLLLPPIPPSISLFQWVNSSHEVAKVWEFQL